MNSRNSIRPLNVRRGWNMQSFRLNSAIIAQMRGVEHQETGNISQLNSRMQLLENQLAEHARQHDRRMELMENQLAEQARQHNSRMELMENQLAEHARQQTNLMALQQNQQEMLSRQQDLLSQMLESQQTLFVQIENTQANLERFKTLLDAQIAAMAAGGESSLRTLVGNSNLLALRNMFDTEITEQDQLSHSGLSNPMKIFVIAGLALIIGVAGWVSWNYIIPYVWPKLVAFAKAVITTASSLVLQLLEYLYTKFMSLCSFCWNNKDTIRPYVEEFVNKGYLSSAAVVMPGFAHQFMRVLQVNTACNSY